MRFMYGILNGFLQNIFFVLYTLKRHKYNLK